MVDTLHMGFQLSGWKSVIDKHSRVLVANLRHTLSKPWGQEVGLRPCIPTRATYRAHVTEKAVGAATLHTKPLWPTG